MRINLVWAAAFAAAFIMLLVWLTRISDAPAKRSNETNPLVADIGARHHLDRLFAADLTPGDGSERVVADAAGVRLDTSGRGFPKRGVWVSQVRQTPMPFTELLPSMNVDTPPECGAVLEVRVRDAHYGDFTPWLYLGKWGRTIYSRKLTTSFERGKVDEDILLLKSPATAYQLRVTLYSFAAPAGPAPTLRSVSAVVTGKGAAAEPRPPATRPAAVDLPVPFIPQGDGEAEVRGEICSPTSTAMVLRYRGIPAELMPSCAAIYDDVYDIFGNWGRAVAFAGALGCDAYLTRLRSLDEARQFLADGQPLVMSIRFKAGEFPSNVQKSTGGHLIVLRGFTAEGDAIINDPASRDRGNRVIYKAAELQKAWQNAGGVVYVIGPRASARQHSLDDPR